MAAQSHFDVVCGALHDDDCVIHHDADRQHDGKQGRKVDGEAKRRHGREGADDRYRHGRRRHQCGANVLQEHQNDNQHQHAGLDQRLIDFIDRGGDEFRRVERNIVPHALREPLATAPPSSLGLHSSRSARWRRATGISPCPRPAYR